MTLLLLEIIGGMLETQDIQNKWSGSWMVIYR